MHTAVVPEPGGPQYFADELTLFEPGRADYPHLLLLAPPQYFSPSGITYTYYVTIKSQTLKTNCRRGSGPTF